MSAATLGRREWLRAALALACVPLAPAGARIGSTRLGDTGFGVTGFGAIDELIPPELAEAASRVGERCRAAGVPADESALLADYRGKSPDDLGSFLAAKVRADFTAGRLIAVGPWWLAETESRVLALL